MESVPRYSDLHLRRRAYLIPWLGKCYNQLCNRNDKWDYEMDHLVLGTIFFTLGSFLMPTMLIYYAFFSWIDYILYVSLRAFDRYCSKFLWH